MFSNTFFTAAFAALVTFSLTGTFDTVKGAALNVIGLYDAAHEIDPWSNTQAEYARHQQALYSATGKLEGLGQAVVMLEFDQRGRLVDGAYMKGLIGNI